MLRIAVVTAHFPSSAEPTQGRSAYQTLRALAKKATLKVFFPHATYPFVFKARSFTYGKVDRSFSPADMDVTYCDYPALPIVSRPFNGWTAARALLPHVRRFAPDVILSYFLYPDGYAALKIGEALSVPVVAKGVGSDVHSIGDRISAMRTRTVLQRSDCLMAVSEDLRQRMVAMGAAEEKTHTIVNGCDLSVFYPADRAAAREKLKISPAAEAIVYVGRLDRRKGLCELVTAAAALQRQRQRLQVYMVGEGQDRGLVEDAIHTANASRYVHAVPNCAFDQVADWMTAANVVTLPSYMEGCPNVVLEALACGRPVVATNVGGIPEIMNESCGRLVHPRDPASLEQALATALDTPWNAEELAARWSRGWDTVAAETLRELESAVAVRRKEEDAGRVANTVSASL